MSKRRPLAQPVPGLPTHVLIKESEEKGSDVSLATPPPGRRFQGDYEQAVVVSNDADFAAAMRHVRDGLDRRVTVLTYVSEHGSMARSDAAELRRITPDQVSWLLRQGMLEMTGMRRTARYGLLRGRLPAVSRPYGSPGSLPPIR